jgi:trehalose 6-phosphate phosphatase
LGRFDYHPVDRNRGEKVKYLFDTWNEFLAACTAAPHILLLADYDGTLTPIVGRPKDAILSPSVRGMLSSLAEKKSFSVGIISGRSIEEIKQFVKLKDIYYSGNHGMEIDGLGLEYRNPAAISMKTLFDELTTRLSAELSDIAGVIVQNKGFSLSVHYRLVKPGFEDKIAGRVKHITLPLQEKGEIKVFEQKKLWEIRPLLDWDKGRAVKLIRQKIKDRLNLAHLLTIYLGDDTTDEDVFKILHRPDGWSIYIGEQKKTSAAEYYLKSTEEVGILLSKLVNIR